MKPVTRRKASQIDPEEERLRNELMDAYLTFVRDAGYSSSQQPYHGNFPVQIVNGGYPKLQNYWASFSGLSSPGGPMDDAGFKNVVELLSKYQDAYTDASNYKLRYNPGSNSIESSVLDTEMLQGNFGRIPKEMAFIDLPDSWSNDNFVSIPRPMFRLDEMNPFELVGFEQEIPDRQLQTGERPQQMDRLKTEPIMRADASVRGGQYQIGERVWDPEKKKWQNRMWDREDKKASRELQGELKEKWRRGLRNIETPPGGFKYGGKIKVKKKNC